MPPKTPEGEPGFGPAYSQDPRNRTGPTMNSMPFKPYGMDSLTVFATKDDVRPNAGFGKVTHPSGAPDKEVHCYYDSTQANNGGLGTNGTAVGVPAASLGLVASFVDATGGGGWGPVATPTLLSTGKVEPRKVIGSVDTSEFLVAWTDARNDLFRTNPNENDNDYIDIYGQRVNAVTGQLVSTGIYESLALLGREEAVARYRETLGRLAEVWAAT